FFLEIDAGDVLRTSSASGSLCCLLRVGLEPSNQFPQVLCRQRVPGNDKRRTGCNPAQRREIVDQVVWERVNCSVSDVATPLPDTDRVAIGSCAGNPANPNAARSTCHVLDDNGLTKRCTHALSHDSSDRVCRAACSKWHDDRDWPRRKRLRP